MFTLLLSVALLGQVETPQTPQWSSLTWNRYATDNFVVLGVDDTQAKYLSDNVEFIKEWSMSRWELPDLKLDTKATLVCVPSKDLFQKFFRSSDPVLNMEYKRDNETFPCMWVWLEDKNWQTSVIPMIITEMCIKNYESKKNNKIPFWMQRAMITLNSNYYVIRNNLVGFKKVFDQDLKCWHTSTIMTITDKEFAEYPEDQKKLFDAQAVALCLFIRKNHNPKFFNALIDLDPKTVMQQMGFSGHVDLDSKYFQYMKDLCVDLSNDKLPNSYILDIGVVHD